MSNDDSYFNPCIYGDDSGQLCTSYQWLPIKITK